MRSASYYVQEKLTSRELDVLKYGTKSLKETGDNLNMADTTVRTHRQNIFRKLNSENITEAIVKSLKLGILRLEDVA